MKKLQHLCVNFRGENSNWKGNGVSRKESARIHSGPGQCSSAQTPPNASSGTQQRCLLSKSISQSTLFLIQALGSSNKNKQKTTNSSVSQSSPLQAEIAHTAAPDIILFWFRWCSGGQQQQWLHLHGVMAVESRWCGSAAIGLSNDALRDSTVQQVAVTPPPA